MIADRRVFIAKKGHIDEAVALLREMAELFSKTFPGTTYRIYASHIAPFDSVAFESEYESLADYEKGVTEFFALPEAIALLERWNEVTEAGGTHEIWSLIE
jgi:hypothetical protein